MSSKFLNTLHGGDLSQLTNGTASIFVKSLKVSDLQGSKDVMTDDDKYLSTGAVSAASSKTQNIVSATPDITTMKGEILGLTKMEVSNIETNNTNFEVNVEGDHDILLNTTLNGGNGNLRLVCNDMINLQSPATSITNELHVPKIKSLAGNAVVELNNDDILLSSFNVMNIIATNEVQLVSDTVQIYATNTSIQGELNVDAIASSSLVVNAATEINLVAPSVLINGLPIGGDTTDLETKTQNIDLATTSTETLLTANLKLGPTYNHSAITYALLLYQQGPTNTEGWQFQVRAPINLTRLKILKAQIISEPVGGETRSITISEVLSNAPTGISLTIDITSDDGTYFYGNTGGYTCTPDKVYVIRSYRWNADDKKLDQPCNFGDEVFAVLRRSTTSGNSFPTEFGNFDIAPWCDFDYTVLYPEGAYNIIAQDISTGSLKVNNSILLAQEIFLDSQEAVSKKYVDDKAVPYDIIFAGTDEVSLIATTGQKIALRATRNVIVNTVKISVNTAGGGSFEVEVRKNGAAFANVIMGSSLVVNTPDVSTIAVDDIISLAVADIGSGTATGLKCYLVGNI
jgi:hypothetical protein